MALNGNTLGDLIKSNMDAYIATLPEGEEPDRTELMRTMGNAIVTHFVANAVISTNVSTTVTGVAPGPTFPSAVTGSGTGTGTGSIS